MFHYQYVTVTCYCISCNFIGSCYRASRFYGNTWFGIWKNDTQCLFNKWRMWPAGDLFENSKVYKKIVSLYNIPVWLYERISICCQMHRFSVKNRKLNNQRTDIGRVGDSHRSMITMATKIEINLVVTMILHRQAIEILNYY